MSFFGRCKHSWARVSANFVPGNDVQRVKAVGQDANKLIEKALYGVTTVVQRCTHCGLERAYTVAGDARGD